MPQKTKSPNPKHTKAQSKPTPAKSPKKNAAPPSIPTLVITILGDCSLSNNQELNPPHVSKSTGGGFPHLVKFEAVVAGWVCLPTGVFTVDPINPVAVAAGTGAGPFIVKPDTAATQISFSHACDKPPCSAGGKTGNGDVIIINA